VHVLDLSSPVDAAGWEPEPISHTVLTPAEGAAHLAAEMRAHFDLEIDPAALPDGEFLNNDTLTLTVHTGTHVDAPAHYGSRTRYGRPRTVDELPLHWFHRPGLLLDLTAVPVGGAADAAFLEREMDRVGHRPDPLDIVLLRTGAAEFTGTQRYFTDFVGLDASAVHLLLDRGVRVIGTDAFSLDAPFTHIIERYRQTGDPATLWPAHMTGREREYCQIERLSNLHAIPHPYGFTVSCFPVKITGAGAGWARAVALFDEE